jgi:hypothetical protein
LACAKRKTFNPTALSIYSVHAAAVHCIDVDARCARRSRKAVLAARAVRLKQVSAEPRRLPGFIAAGGATKLIGLVGGPMRALGKWNESDSEELSSKDGR